jgi:hypothetical protein
VRTCQPQPKLLRRVKRAGRFTDAARDAAVIAALLEHSVGDGERSIVQPLLLDLREKERTATQEAWQRLRGLSFS